MDYKSRFKDILKEEIGINGREYSELMGIGYDYYRKCTQSKKVKGRKDVVGWIRLFVIAFELGKERGIEVEKKSSNARGVNN